MGCAVRKFKKWRKDVKDWKEQERQSLLESTRYWKRVALQQRLEEEREAQAKYDALSPEEKYKKKYENVYHNYFKCTECGFQHTGVLINGEPYHLIDKGSMHQRSIPDLRPEKRYWRCRSCGGSCHNGSMRYHTGSQGPCMAEQYLCKRCTCDTCRGLDNRYRGMGDFFPWEFIHTKKHECRCDKCANPQKYPKGVPKPERMWYDGPI